MIGIAEIGLDIVSFNVVMLMFKGVLPLPTALKVKFAKITSPLTPPRFQADTVTIPLSLSTFEATTVDAGPFATTIT